MVTLIYKELYYIYPHGDEVSNVDVVFYVRVIQERLRLI